MATGGSADRKEAARRGRPILAFGVAALALPGLALAGVGAPEAGSLIAASLGAARAPFTPAQVDPALAARVAQDLAAKGDALRFTPGGLGDSAKGGRIVNVAVRIDNDVARAIGVRSGAERARPGTARERIAIAPTQYDLGLSRGYAKFARPVAEAAALPEGVARVAMPDLAKFRPAETADKPSRFQPRIALEQDDRAGRSPRTFDGLGAQSVDLGGAYRVTRNLDVTAGVRLSQDRDRLAPLTDGVEDDQAVYVGTQIKF